jgi:hypothetical protein
MAIEKGINNCESSYIIVLWTSIILTILSITCFIFRLGKKSQKTEKETRINFRLWSLLIYTLANTSGLILVVGVNLACHGDGQILLACIYSGPIASIIIIIFGLLSDLKIKISELILI